MRDGVMAWWRSRSAGRSERAASQTRDRRAQGTLVLRLGSGASAANQTETRRCRRYCRHIAGFPLTRPTREVRFDAHDERSGASHGGDDDVDGGAGAIQQPADHDQRERRARRDATVAPAQVEIAGKQVTTTVYNGVHAAAAARAAGRHGPAGARQPGTDDANIHYHGLAVTPIVPGDNVFLLGRAGDAVPVRLPDSRRPPQGLFWYHPHVHPGVNPAIASGRSGGMIIGDVLKPFPELADITRRPCC